MPHPHMPAAHTTKGPRKDPGWFVCVRVCVRKRDREREREREREFLIPGGAENDSRVHSKMLNPNP
jgi:hypothetical protein